MPIFKRAKLDPSITQEKLNHLNQTFGFNALGKTVKKIIPTIISETEG